MTEGKYAKLIKTEPFEKSMHAVITAPIVRYKGKEYANADLTYAISYITQPLQMIKEPHKHDFDQFVCFFGGDPTDFQDFKAEIEFWMEGEKYIINKAATVYIPRGLVHGPLYYRKIDKPILFLDIAVTGDYVKLPVSR
jgi:hypothetical protein